MSRYTPIEILDLIASAYVEANEEVVCSQQPTTFFNACWPSIWNAETSFAIGEVTRAPTQNGFVYECIAEGISAATEPPWEVTQDAVFNDGTVQWKAHENYALINAPLLPEDKTLSTSADNARILTISQKMGILIHTSGEVGHTALIDTVTKKLKYVTVAKTTLQGDNLVVSGRTTLLHELSVAIPQPVEMV